MKKLSTIVLMMFIVSLFFTGCEGQNTQNQNSEAKGDDTLTAIASLTAFYSDCLSSDDIIVDEKFEKWYSQQYGEIIAQEPLQNITVVFDGKEYSGVFDNTIVNSLGMCIMHSYSGDDVFFKIDATNGELLSINIGQRFVDTEISDELFEACRDEAKRIAAQYIDTSYFILEEEKTDIGMNFVYRQFVSGVETENYLQVAFDKRGVLMAFNRYVSEGYKLISQGNSSDIAKLVKSLSSDMAEQTALNEVNNIFARQDVNKCEIEHQKLYVMPDGKLVRAYSFDVEIKDDNATKDESGDLLYSPKHTKLNMAIFE